MRTTQKKKFNTKKRNCLGCKKVFPSSGVGNRFCDACQKRLPECYKDSRYVSHSPEIFQDL